MRTLIFILIFSSTSTITFALYPNLYHKKEVVVKKRARNIPDITYTFDTSFAKEFVADFDFEQPANYPFQELSDAGVYLTQLGQNNTALDVFKWLHEQHTEEYNIASNLGVAHELNGNLDSAEHYLLKAFDLSPHTHPKGEWVQLKIIAAKRSMKTDPDWLLHHQVLNLNWDTLFYNSNSNKNYSKQQRDSLQFLRYTTYKNQFDTLWSVGNVMQAHIPYVSAPNLLVANVMKELGYYFAVNLSIKDAFVAYKIALHYDPKNQLHVEQELAKLMPHFKKYGFEESIFDTKFQPAASSLSPENAIPPDKNSSTQKSIPILFWQAGVALFLLMLILGYSLFSNRKN